MSDDISRDFLQTDEDTEESSSGNKTGLIATIVMAALLVGVIGVLIYSYVSRSKIYVDFDVLQVEEALADAKSMRCSGGFIRYNSDGAQGYDNEAKLIWQITYSYRDPIAAVNGAYAVFADRGGRTACVTDGTGANKVLNLPWDISTIAVSANGVTAYMTDAGEKDHIYLYDFNLTLLLDVETIVRKTGFPITMAISSDGHKMVTSYMKVGQEQENRITFYNFGEVGQSYTDRIVGSYSYGEELVPDIRFVTDDRVCIVTNGKCDIYKFREIPEELRSLEYESGILGIANDPSHILLATATAAGDTRLDIYSADGVKQNTIHTPVDYDSMYIGRNEVLLTSGASCIIYELDGTQKFSMHLDDTIELAINTSDPAAYIVVGNRKTARIRLKTAADEIK